MKLAMLTTMCKIKEKKLTLSLKTRKGENINNMVKPPHCEILSVGWEDIKTFLTNYGGAFTFSIQSTGNVNPSVT